MKKVLVGCPTSDHKSYCLEEYAKIVKSLSYSNYDVLLVDNSKEKNYFEKLKENGLDCKRIDYIEGARERITQSRNIIREEVLKGDYDYFFSLEQDVIPPKDVIERLLKHEKDVIGGVYFKDYLIKNKAGEVIKKQIMPLAYKLIGDNMAKQFTFRDVAGEGLLKVDATGLGCILIKRNVLEKIKFRYVKEKEPFDDLWFCKDVKESGRKLFLDKSVKCKHLIEGMDWSKINK